MSDRVRAALRSRRRLRPVWRLALGLLCSGLAPIATARAQVALPFTTTVEFTGPGQIQSFLVDLGTLPLRPVLVAVATPDGMHADMSIELEIGDIPQIGGDANTCPGPLDTFVSDPEPGATEVRWDVWNCDPRVDAFAGTTATVTLRGLDFGSWGPPADVELVIRGETRVPFGTELTAYAPSFDTQTEDVPISKDTVIYERDGTGSNGLGEFLWAGTDAEPDMYGGTERYAIRSLLAFSVASIVPASAVVEDVQIDVEVLSLVGVGNVVDLHRVAADTGWPPISWPEGDADAAGDEFLAAPSSITAATWLARASPSIAWGAVGGDPANPLSMPLASQPITATGPASFSSAGLTAAVAQMAATGEDRDGFLLTSPLASGEAVDVGYEQVGVVHGAIEILGEPRLEFAEVPAHRWHRWTTHDVGFGPLTMPEVRAHSGVRAPFAFPDGTVSDLVLTRDGWARRAVRPP